MGALISYLASYIFSTPDEPMPELTELTQEQVAIIKETWQIPKSDLTGAGEAILYRFFEQHPVHQEKFKAFKNTPLLSLKGTPGFRSHALRIMNVFDEAINALDKENGLMVVIRIWNDIAVQHAKRKINVRAFNQLRIVILEVLTDACKLNEEQQKAWNSLIDNVYHILFSKLKIEAEKQN